VTRYAPLQTNPERFGILPSAHDPSYDLIFSRDFLAQSSFDLDAFCYYFERPFENSPRLNQRYREIDRLVDHWKQQQELRSVCLWYEQTASGADIFDSRCEPPTVIHLTRAEAYLVLATSDPISFQQLKKQYEGLFGREEFDAVIKGIEARGLLFREAGMVVGLALPRAIYEATKECAR